MGKHNPNIESAYLEYLTAVKGEDEVIFPCGTTFEVEGVKKD
jgi:hypothetical protein